MAASLASFPNAHDVYTLTPTIGTVAPTTFMLGNAKYRYLINPYVMGCGLVTAAFMVYFIIFAMISHGYYGRKNFGIGSLEISSEDVFVRYYVFPITVFDADKDAGMRYPHLPRRHAPLLEWVFTPAIVVCRMLFYPPIPVTDETKYRFVID